MEGVRVIRCRQEPWKQGKLQELPAASAGTGAFVTLESFLCTMKGMR